MRELHGRKAEETALVMRAVEGYRSCHRFWLEVRRRFDIPFTSPA